MIERPDWDESAAGRPQANTPKSAATSAEQTVSREVSVVGPSADEDDDARHRRLIESGVATPEEVGRIYGLTPDEVVALAKPMPKAPSRQEIEAELAEIAQRRRTDRRGYFKDEAIQARERELIEQREQLKAAPAPEKAVREPGNAPGLDPALLKEWEDAGGVEFHLATAQRATQAAFEAMPEEERADFQAGFDGLPDGAQTAVFRYLALEPGGSVRPATDAAVQNFASTPEGAELVASWGRNAARNVGVVRSRMELMLRSMPEADREVALSWFDSLKSSQAKAVLRALVGV